DDPFHVTRLFADVQLVDAGGAGGRREKAGEHADRGGLSRAVGSEKSDDLAALHLEGDAAYRLDVSITLRQLAGDDDGVAHPRILTRHEQAGQVHEDESDEEAGDVPRLG